MTTQAVASYGLTLKWNGVTLAEITDVSGPGVKIDTIDVTSYTSPDAFKEFIAGFGDGGEIGIEGNFIPGDTPGQIAFIADAFAKTVREAIITHAVAGIDWTFDALVTSLDFKQPMTEQLGFTAALKVSGKPVLGVTASAGASVLTGIEENTGAALVLKPAFDIAKFTYADEVNTASNWIKLTVTAAGVITATALGVEYPLVTTVQSGEITIDVANSVTLVVVRVKEAGKVAKEYAIYVARA